MTKLLDEEGASEDDFFQSIEKGLCESREALLNLTGRNPLLKFNEERKFNIRLELEEYTKIFAQMVGAKKSIDLKSNTGIQENNEGLVAKVHSLPLLGQMRKKQLEYVAETGINALFISFGLLERTEHSHSEEIIKSPLLLIPVEIAKSKDSTNYQLNYTGPNVQVNLSLIERLKKDYGFDIVPRDTNFEEETDIERYLEDYFQKVETAIRGCGEEFQNWNVDRNTAYLSFFNYDSFLLYEDLDPENWRNCKNIKRSVISNILGKGFEAERQSKVKEDSFDNANLCYVTDIDSTQADVLYEVCSGKSLVVQGPPGTGKSQTIVNIMASSVKQGKSILFVTEKMAALEVVKNRLKKLGLGETVLQLHSGESNRKSFYADLSDTMNIEEADEVSHPRDLHQLKNIRNELNSMNEVMETVIENTELTSREVIGRVISLRDEIDESRLNDLKIKNIGYWSANKFFNVKKILEKYCRLIDSYGNPRKNPFYECLIQKVRGRMEFIEIHERIEEFRDILLDYDDKYSEYSARGMPLIDDLTPEDLEIMLDSICFLEKFEKKEGYIYSNPNWIEKKDEISNLIHEGRETIKKARDIDYELYKPGTWRREELLEENEIDCIKKFNGKWQRFFNLQYLKSVRKVMRLCKRKKTIKGYLEIINEMNFVKGLLDELDKKYMNISPSLMEKHEWKDKHINWDDIEESLGEMSNVLDTISTIYGKIYKREIAKEVLRVIDKEYAYSSRTSCLEELQGFLKKIASEIKYFQRKLHFSKERSGVETIVVLKYSFARLKKLFEQWAGSSYGELEFMAEYNKVRERLLEEGLEGLLDIMDKYEMTPEEALLYYEAKRHYAVLNRAKSRFGKIIEFNSLDYKEKVSFLRKHSSLEMKYNKNCVVAAHRSAVSNYRLENDKNLPRMIYARKTPPIRLAFGQCGKEIQKLKPIIMMNPKSISNYIPPDSVDFDLVIFDESSQISPVDAFGALLRGRQAVVIGDDKQLPPTNFFRNIIEEEVDDESSIINPKSYESILSLFHAQGCRSKMLKWHYRSEHPSLIQVSNIEFYDSNLILFPSPYFGADNERGLKFKYVRDSIYESGGRRVNQQEAKSVAQEVLNHAKKHQGQSLGVATFSIAQKEEIEKQINHLRSKDISCEHFFENGPKGERFFVKNLEAVQGDERDVLLVSVGYGKNAEGKLSKRSFGPLINDGGERRLNVIMTRARKRCVLFANFKHFELNLDNSKSLGLRALKQFLNYAENRKIENSSRTTISKAGQCESPFEVSVYQELEKSGHRAHPQHKVLDYFIDLVVENPENPGVYLCGIECDGATYHRTKWARDRDMIRQLHLENQGWIIYRIWSTDWFNSKEREMKKLLEFLKKREMSLKCELN